MKTNKIPYDFRHIQISLISFIADFEKKVHFVFSDIPVLMENIDDSYVLFKKYSKTELQEQYNKVPRIVFNIQEVQAKLENNSTQFLKMNYVYNEVEYNTQFRRISTGIMIELKMVCSNYLKALEYWEFILSLLCVDNVFTYEHFGNTYQGSYLLQSPPLIEKQQLSNSTSESKNTLLNATIELNCFPTFINFNTIEVNNGLNGFLIDTDIIDIIEGPGAGTGAIGYDKDGLIHSKINTTQDLNDLGPNNEEEKKLLKNRKRIKTGSNVFDIESQTTDAPEMTYRTIMKTDIYIKPEDNE